MPNLVNLPSNIYAGGSTVLNPQPYVNYIIQAQARQQAKRDAVDNYYRDLSKTLTPAGMAGNDVEDFTNKVNAWKDFVTTNRNILNNPNDKNYANVVNNESHLYNDAMQHAAISKDKVATLTKVNDIRLSHPDYNFTDAATQALDAASKPISKGYQPLDMGVLQYDTKPADASDIQKYQNAVSSGFKMNDVGNEISVDPKTKNKNVVIKSAYSPADLNQMATRAEFLYKSDRKLQDLVNKASQDPATYQQLNTKFKSIYGHDLDIQHPEEFATALLLPQTEQTRMQEKNFAPTTVKINMSDAKDQQTVNSLDNYITQLQANASPRTYKHANGTSETHYEMQPSPQLSNMFATKVGTQTIYPDQIQFLPNGDVLPIYYKTMTDKSGNTVSAIGANGGASVDQTLSKPVSQSEFKIRLAKELFGEKGVAATMNAQGQQQKPQSKPSAKPTQKTKTYKGLDKDGNPIFE